MIWAQYLASTLCSNFTGCMSGQNYRHTETNNTATGIQLGFNLQNTCDKVLDATFVFTRGGPLFPDGRPLVQVGDTNQD